MCTPNAAISSICNRLIHYARFGFKISAFSSTNWMGSSWPNSGFHPALDQCMACWPTCLRISSSYSHLITSVYLIGSHQPHHINVLKILHLILSCISYFMILHYSKSAYFDLNAEMFGDLLQIVSPACIFTCNLAIFHVGKTVGSFAPLLTLSVLLVTKSIVETR